MSVSVSVSVSVPWNVSFTPHNVVRKRGEFLARRPNDPSSRERSQIECQTERRPYKPTVISATTHILVVSSSYEAIGRTAPYRRTASRRLCAVRLNILACHNFRLLTSPALRYLWSPCTRYSWKPDTLEYCMIIFIHH